MPKQPKFTADELETIEEARRTRILITSAQASPEIFAAYALWCKQQKQPQVIVAAFDKDKRTFSIVVETYSKHPGLTWEQREKLYDILKPHGEIVPLSIPSPDHENSLDVHWGILEVPELPMQMLAADVLAVLYPEWAAV